MDDAHWLERFFDLEVACTVETDCPQRNVPVRISRGWRFGLVCEHVLPPLNGQRWLPLASVQERHGCDGCPIQEVSRAFLRNGAQPPTETDRWLDEMERSAKRPPTMTVWDDGSGTEGG